MSKFPILVENFDAKHPADLAICERCESTSTIDPADGDPYDRCLTHEGCGGQILFKFDAGEKCLGCGKLDYSQPVDGCCSRACRLQADYAAELASRRAS